MRNVTRSLALLIATLVLPALTLSQLPKYPEGRFPHPICKEPAKVLKLKANCYGVEIAPSGKHAAVLTTDRVYLIDIANQQVLASVELSFATGVHFSPDGKWLARRGPFGPKEAPTCNMAVYEASGLKPVKVPLEPVFDRTMDMVSWSSDGTYLAAGINETFNALGPYDTIVWDAKNWQAPGKRIRPLEGLPKNAYRSLPGLFLGQNLYIVLSQEAKPGVMHYYVHEYTPPDWRLAGKFGPAVEKCSFINSAIFAYKQPHLPHTMFWAGQLSHVGVGNLPQDPHIWSFSSKTKRIEDWGAMRHYLDRLNLVEKHLGFEFPREQHRVIFLPVNDKTLVTWGGTNIQLTQQTDKGPQVEELYYDGYRISRAEAIAPEKNWLVVGMVAHGLGDPLGNWVIGVLDLKTRRRVGPAYHYNSPLLQGSVGITPDGQYVLIAYEDGTLHFWRVTDSESKMK